MKSLQIPPPPPTPNGDRWVENWRGADSVQYFSEDGCASIWLQLVSDSDGRRMAWTGYEVIVGIDMRAVASDWEQGQADRAPELRLPPLERNVPPVKREPYWYLGKDEQRRLQDEKPSEPPPGFSFDDGEWVREAD